MKTILKILVKILIFKLTELPILSFNPSLFIFSSTSGNVPRFVVKIRI